MSGTSAFDGISDAYARFRPHYPTAVLQRLWDYALAEGPASPVGWAIDVGAGTGISTLALRQSAPDWIEIVAVEPGRDMRLQAERALAGMDDVKVVDGKAESMPFADGTACLVLAAQSIQWFERQAFYREADRVLQAGGCLALLQNNRNWQVSALLEAYESFLEEHGESYSRHYRDLPLGGELEALASFHQVTSLHTEWVRTMKLREMLGMALSSTKMQSVVAKFGEEKATSMLSDVLSRHAGDEGDIQVPYTTELFMARRRQERAKSGERAK
jgi:ubiquinone/menaquinone biosynthesis C-methylase UbiE